MGHKPHRGGREEDRADIQPPGAQVECSRLRVAPRVEADDRVCGGSEHRAGVVDGSCRLTQSKNMYY